MNSNDFRFGMAALVCIFLFSGEPDVWDKLHERAILSTAPEKCQP